ncbi:hypothetical protein, partial [Rhizobium sp. Root1203]|uniref:hypothetical protein n=1 Tax=Rhizobium sp. Root1203 TaxID=1736427 RepID=UPI001AECBDF2
LQRAGTNDGGGIIEAEIHLAKRPKLFRQTEPPLIESRHRYSSNADLQSSDQHSLILRAMDLNLILCNGLPKSCNFLI